MSIESVQVHVREMPKNWQDYGACRGAGHLFFAIEAERPQACARREMAARAVCASCVVFNECLEYISAHEEYGFWAGLSERDRHVRKMLLPPYLNSYMNRDRSKE